MDWFCMLAELKLIIQPGHCNLQIYRLYRPQFAGETVLAYVTFVWAFQFEMVYAVFFGLTDLNRLKLFKI